MISHQATTKLRQILEKELPNEYFVKLTDEDIRHFGELILWTVATTLKNKVKSQ